MIRIILDTNLIINLAKTGINLKDEVNRLINLKNEICIIDNTQTELDLLISKAKSEKQRKLLYLAYELSHDYKIIKTGNEYNLKVDDLLLKFALEGNTVIATNDKELRKKLRDSRLPTLFIRSRKSLELEGYVKENEPTI